MDSRSIIIPSLLKISKAMEQAFGVDEQRIHAIYPKAAGYKFFAQDVIYVQMPLDVNWQKMTPDETAELLESVISQAKQEGLIPERPERVETLMDALGMAFIASADAYLRMANSLLSFVVMAVGDMQEQYQCPYGQENCNLYYHFGLKHHHLENFHNFETVEMHEYYWNGYQAVAMAPSHEHARGEAEEILTANQTNFVDELKAGLPPIGSVDKYDATFIKIAGDNARLRSASGQADERLLTDVSAQIDALIQDPSALMYTLLGGGDEEVMLFGAADAYLKLAKGLVDFVVAARKSWPNQPLNKPLISTELRSLFDTAYSVYPMDTVCLAETETELERALAFFRLEAT